MTEKVAKLINEQINKELYSAYFYMDIAAYYGDKNLSGFENWFTVQTQEERDHALLFAKFLQNNGIRPVFQAVAAPDKNFGDFREPLVAIYDHERYVTSLINDIFAAAQEAKDFRTLQFLDWFVKEQGEEEKNTDDLLKRFDLFGSDPKALYMLDRELAARVYAAPSLVI